MTLRLLAVSAFLAAARLAMAAEGVEQPVAIPVLGTDTVHGCYSSLGNLQLNATLQYNTQGACNEACRGMGKTVGASQSSNCYCGDKYPGKDTLVADSKCTEPCPGFGDQACGGLDTYTVYNTGVRVSVADEANSTDSTSTSAVPPSVTSAVADATSTKAAVVTETGTVVVTPTSTASSSSGSGSGTSTIGVAVGCVAGVLAIAGIAGAAFFVVRRRRNREIEEEHRRNAAVNAFIAGGKPPSTSGGLSISDQRLDPVMVQRRMSSGSIADEQDYSRRILRVTNA